MGHKEFHIDGRYKLFGNYYHGCVENRNSNPFWAAHRTFMQAAVDAPTIAHRDRFEAFDAMGYLATDPQGNKYIPLTANVVIPDGVGTAPWPLAIFIHGQASSYMDEDDHPIPEVKSYRGYGYLQEYLAGKGIASVSVNVNIVNYLLRESFQFHPLGRIEITILVLVLLSQLSGTPFSTNQPIFFKKSDGTLIPLDDGLALSPPFPAGSQERLLHDLKAALKGKLSFTKLGFMGHSKGGVAIQLLPFFFTPRSGVAPTPAQYATPGNADSKELDVPKGSYNTNTVLGNSFPMHHHLYHYIMNLMALLGSPTLNNLKTMVALQPEGKMSLLDSTTIFYLVVASSHDEDAEESALNNYENVNSPKAMLFSHGACHVRFNTVWRQLSDKRSLINKLVACQSPIHLLSNSAHEDLAKATVGNAFLAGLLDEHHRYRFFTGEFRATGLKQDIERAWKFPYPFQTGSIKLLDAAGIKAVLSGTIDEVTPTQIVLNSRKVVTDIDNYVNEVKVKAYTRPANKGLTIRIPVANGDNLVSRTHFSFRYTKEYNARSAAARKKVNLRHYSVQLKSDSKEIGIAVQGKDVASPHHVAYEAYDYNVLDKKCENDTLILLQTAEIPLSQLLGTQPLTDLNQVNQIELKIIPLPGASSTNETFFFVDFLLSTRNLPAPPPGFAIP